MKCWYCLVREAESVHDKKFEMYGEVEAKKGDVQTDVAYKVRHVVVPRCADCHSRHRIAARAGLAGIVTLLLLLAGVLALVFHWVPDAVSGIWAGLAAGLAVGALFSRRAAQKGILTVANSRSQYPEIKELLEKCYRFGQRPGKKLPENSQPCDKEESKNP